MGSDEIRDEVKRLGKEFQTIRSKLSDLRMLSDPGYCDEFTQSIARIRNCLVELGAAYRLDDGNIIIRSRYIVSFFEPDFVRGDTSYGRDMDLSDPEVVQRVALTCGIKQWLFLAEQIKNKEEREQFLRNCARIVAEHSKRI